uniref:Putative secreted peptide n=1 Tax=Anopheles braziliensis TaxID=58242 RepID=A0A2M3ZUJ1_9DIPT
MLQPVRIRILWLCATVSLRQCFRVDMLVQGSSIRSVEEQPLAHLLREQWFKDLEGRIKHPTLVDDVNLASSLRHAGC